MLLILELSYSGVGNQLPRGCRVGGYGGGVGCGGGGFGGGVGGGGSNQGRGDLGIDFDKEGVVEASRNFGVVVGVGIGAGVYFNVEAASTKRAARC